MVPSSFAIGGSPVTRSMMRQPGLGRPRPPGRANAPIESGATVGECRRERHRSLVHHFPALDHTGDPAHRQLADRSSEASIHPVNVAASTVSMIPSAVSRRSGLSAQVAGLPSRRRQIPRPTRRTLPAAGTAHHRRSCSAGEQQKGAGDRVHPPDAEVPVLLLAGQDVHPGVRAKPVERRAQRRLQVPGGGRLGRYRDLHVRRSSSRRMKI